MDDLIHLSWRAYPASILIGIGLAFVGVGIRRMVGGIRGTRRAPLKAIVWMAGFRTSVLGLALAGIAAAWLWHVPLLLALALVIGAEETFESSAYIWTLERKGRFPRKQRG
jgi:hypothetical protein